MKRLIPIAVLGAAVFLGGCESLLALGGGAASFFGQAGIATVQEKARVRTVYRAEIDRLVAIQVQDMVTQAKTLSAAGKYDQAKDVWDDVFERLDAAMPKWLLPELIRGIRRPAEQTLPSPL